MALICFDCWKEVPELHAKKMWVLRPGEAPQLRWFCKGHGKQEKDAIAGARTDRRASGKAARKR